MKMNLFLVLLVLFKLQDTLASNGTKQTSPSPLNYTTPLFTNRPNGTVIVTSLPSNFSTPIFTNGPNGSNQTNPGPLNYTTPLFTNRPNGTVIVTSLPSNFSTPIFTNGPNGSNQTNPGPLNYTTPLFTNRPTSGQFNFSTPIFTNGPNGSNFTTSNPFNFTIQFTTEEQNGTDYDNTTRSPNDLSFCNRCNKALPIFDPIEKFLYFINCKIECRCKSLICEEGSFKMYNTALTKHFRNTRRPAHKGFHKIDERCMCVPFINQHFRN